MNQFQMRFTHEQLLHMLWILNAGHLQKNLMRVLTTVALQGRFGDANRVDAAVDNLHGLVSR